MRGDNGGMKILVGLVALLTVVSCGTSSHLGRDSSQGPAWAYYKLTLKAGKTAWSVRNFHKKLALKADIVLSDGSKFGKKILWPRGRFFVSEEWDPRFPGMKSACCIRVPVHLEERIKSIHLTIKARGIGKKVVREGFHLSLSRGEKKKLLKGTDSVRKDFSDLGHGIAEISKVLH